MERYITPEVEIVVLKTEDIILNSMNIPTDPDESPIQ